MCHRHTLLGPINETELHTARPEVTTYRFYISKISVKSMLLFTVINVYFKTNTMINVNYISNYVAFLKATNEKV
jgi:hypothetical protein